MAGPMATLAGRNFGRKGLNFGRMKLLAPPKKRPRYAYAKVLLVGTFNKEEAIIGASETS